MQAHFKVNALAPLSILLKGNKMIAHVFRANGGTEDMYVDVRSSDGYCSAAYEIAKKCNLKYRDIASFCIASPYYRVTSPDSIVRSYAVAVERGALYLAEYDCLKPSTFPKSASDMSVIGNVR